jgi:hypothetical protein
MTEAPQASELELAALAPNIVTRQEDFTGSFAGGFQFGLRPFGATVSHLEGFIGSATKFGTIASTADRPSFASQSLAGLSRAADSTITVGDFR